MKFDLSTLKLNEGTYSVGVKAKNGSHSESLLSSQISYNAAPRTGKLRLGGDDTISTSSSLGSSHYMIKLGSAPTNLKTDYDYYGLTTKNGTKIDANTEISLKAGTTFYAWADHKSDVSGYAYFYADSTYIGLTTSPQSFTVNADVTYSFRGISEMNCLTGDTIITMSDGSEKRIDTLNVGDKILSYNPETGILEEDAITYSDSADNKQHDNFDVWTFDDGTIIKTVHRHRFYNAERGAMVYMDEWKIGERGRRKDGALVKLISHENIIETINHYTIFTHNQNYFANGFLSGNRYTKHINF